MSKIKIFKILGFIGLILFGIFFFIYGGYDDSPGAQGLAIPIIIGGIYGLVKQSKIYQKEKL